MDWMKVFQYLTFHIPDRSGSVRSGRLGWRVMDLLVRNEACLYAAIDAPRDDHDRLLREMIAPIVRELHARPELDSLFVVRYAEPDWQLRFRVLGRPEWIEAEVRPRVERGLEPFRSSGAI